ncbi:TPA: hypothetical protein IAA86_06380 [Candidatus Galligastranaerophilus intestinavium]|uniref:Flagellin n=1 Tax=Candidatus Galligastranaerophilus intestinavium TaxID=2840836 RepID=A0A9D1FJG8_9BACT|nr:hypothetical protein [Candidatus Galligastranaerophilus intestinavium]
MAISVNTNVPSLIAQNSLNRSLSAMEKAMQQLTTGKRINNAGDDAAGLVISENMRVQINGSNKAMDNVQDAQNFAAVAEGGMITIGDHLQRINELLIQGANDTNSVESRQAILVEVKQRLEDINVIAQSTQFNGRTMLDGTFGDAGESFIVQIGPYSDTQNADNPLNTLDISGAFTDCHLSTLGIGTTTGAAYDGIILPAELDPDDPAFDPTGDNFRLYMDTVQAAITEVTEARGLLGGYLNRMTSTYDNLTITVENMTTAKSRITDTDVAEASSEMIKQQILEQVSGSMLTQANQLPSLALSLI